MIVQLSFGWIQIAAAAASIQGLVLAAVLVAHPGKRTANRLLAAAMAAFSLYLMGTVYYGSSLAAEYPRFFGISYPTPWLFGPLIYLYAATASDADRTWRGRDALHFVPAAIVVLIAVPIYLMDAPEKLRMLERFQAGDVPLYIALIDPTKYLSGIIYSVATVVVLRRHRQRVRDNYSTVERVNLRWLVSLSACAAGVWLLAVAIRIAGLLPHSGRINGDGIISLAIAILVYAIGYLGLRQPEIHYFDVTPPRPAAAPFAEQPAEPEARYERSGLAESEAAALKSGLLALMQRERPYRDADLTLAALAARLETTPHKLSQVLNAELGQTFYDFVNGFRVEEVRRRLGEPESRHLSVLTLAMDAGFSSKSTFNQAFRKVTGTTPTAFRSSVG